MAEPIHILHVDDEPDFADMAATFLERADDRFTVETVASACEGLDRLANDVFECIVCDYDMPHMNGIEFLEAVREDNPDLPVILFTGKGSEEVASDAIAAGATDYLQKGTDTVRYDLLANRIQNAVEQYRNTQRRTQLERIRTLVNDISHQLVRASSQQEIVTNVCSILADADPYQFAVFAEVDPDTKRIEPQTWRGIGSGFLDEFEMSVTESAPGRQAPVGQAYYEREVAVAQNLQSDSAYEQWRELALAHGFQSLAVVPLEYDDELYGLLAVFADRLHAFDDIERELLGELGDDIAHALHARKVRQKLRRTKRRFDAVFDNPMSLIGIVAPDGSLIDANQTAINLINQPIEDVVGSPFWETPWWTHSNEIQKELQAWISRAAEGEYVRFEAENHTETGETVIIDGVLHPIEDGEGEIVELMAAGRDITAIRNRERELTMTHRRMELALEVTNSIIWDINLATEESTKYGPVERMFGVDPTGMEGFITEVVHPEDRDDVETIFEELQQDETEVFDVEFRTHSDQGEAEWIKSQGFVREGDDPSERHLIGLATDITEQKRREQKLQRQNTRLEEFTSIVSHDLRSPLGVLEGRLELAQMECDSEHLDDCVDAVDRCQRLIDDLLTLAREGGEVTEMETVGLDSVVEECRRYITTDEATFDTGTDLEIRCDRSRLQQALSNLIRNAVDHAGPGVTIKIDRMDDQSGFYVADDGPGIPEDEREEVFELGHSTAEEGTGFGLAIVQKIIQSHDWDIRVTDSESGGARFEITGVEFIE